jgi:hypothetical protein
VIVAFTIGHTKSYDQSLAECLPEECMKTGAHDDYEGGWIWKTAKEAEDFIHSENFLKVDWGDNIPRPPEKFSVYRVELVNGWDDVSPVPGKDGVFHLLVSSRFYK